MTTFFVIAGSHEEARTWALKNKEKLATNNLVPQFLAGIDQLRGSSEPRGIFIGSWYTRSDAIDILQQLVMTTESMRKKQIFSELVRRVVD